MALKINNREKYALMAGGAVLVVFVLVQFVIFPFLDKRARLKRQLGEKSKTLEEMINLKTEYDTIKKQVDMLNVRFAKRKRNFTLFSFLEKLAGQAHVKENITYMKPSTTTQINDKFKVYKISMVEMKLQSITLEQLTQYLHMIETSKNMVKIQRISISKASSQKGYINAVLQVETVVI
jgi:general secretion pathway protein M